MRTSKLSRGLSIAVVAALILAVSACDSGGGSANSSARTQPPAPTSSGAAATGRTSGAAGHDCYVELFDGDHFKDDHFKLTEPGRYSNLTSLPGASQDWTDEADSLKVGSGANVTVWAQTDFQGKSQKLEAGTDHPAIDTEPSSLELTC